jgi:hypothetical protein
MMVLLLGKYHITRTLELAFSEPFSLLHSIKLRDLHPKYTLYFAFFPIISMLLAIAISRCWGPRLLALRVVTLSVQSHKPWNVCPFTVRRRIFIPGFGEVPMKVTTLPNLHCVRITRGTRETR